MEIVKQQMQQMQRHDFYGEHKRCMPNYTIDLPKSATLKAAGQGKLPLNNLDEEDAKWISLEAAKVGNLDVIKELQAGGHNLHHMCVMQAASLGQYDMVKHLIYSDPTFAVTPTTLAAAIRDGTSPDLIDYLIGLDVIDTIPIEVAAGVGDARTLDRLLDRYEDATHFNVVANAIGSEDIDTIRVALKYAKSISAHLVTIPIIMGNLAIIEEVMKYCPCISIPMTAAIMTNQLDALKLVYNTWKDNTVPNKKTNIDTNVVTVAIMFDDLNMVKYLCDECGVEASEHALSGAALHGKLDMVKYLVEDKEMTVTDDMITKANHADDINVLTYLCNHL